MCKPIWPAFLAIVGALGCGGGAEPAASGSSSEALARIDPAALPQRGHYTVERDLRLCAWPACGGYWVRSVNRDDTLCADGVARPACYVASIDWFHVGLREGDRYAFEDALARGRGLVGGSMVARAADQVTLVVDEGWQAIGERAAEGGFYRLAPSGCVRPGCAAFVASYVGGDTREGVTAVDLRRIGASAAALETAGAALRTSTGIVATGELRPRAGTRGAAATSQVFVATQAYLKVASTRPPLAACSGANPCADGSLCDTAAGACGADALGVCRATPSVCDKMWDPVCGCDGRTYGNDCERMAAGARLDHAGVCTPTG